MSETAQKDEPLNNLRAIVSARDLRRALALAAKATSNKSSIPALNCAKLTVGYGVLSITTTDMDNELTVTIPLGSAPQDPIGQGHIGGSVLVPLRELLKIVSAVGPGNVELSQDEPNAMSVTCGAAHYSLSAHLPVEDFPLPKTVSDDGHLFKLSAESVRGLIDKTRCAISTEETRYYLKGVYLHVALPSDGAAELRAVATDGHRLVVTKMPVPEGAEVMPWIIVPHKTIGILREMARASWPVLVLVGGNNMIRFVSDGVTLTAKLIDGTYPDYDKVIPKEPKLAIQFDAAAFLAVVRRVGACCDRNFSAMRLVITPGECGVSVADPTWGHAEETFPCDYGGERFEIGFNRRYLTDMLKVIGPNKAQAAIIDAASPVVWSNPDDPSLTHVLMPMRVV